MSDVLSEIVVGDSVMTKNAMFFVEASHPETGDMIETLFPRWHRLKVVGVDEKEGTITVELPDGYVAILSTEDVEL